MTSSPGDETGPERNRHRSREPRVPRWRRRHVDEEVAELDPAEAAKLIQRTARADRESTTDDEDQGDESAETVHRARDDDPARRVFSDALETGLADPTPPPDRRHLLPRRRQETERPEPPRGEGSEVAGPQTTGHPDLEARLRAAEERAEENAAQLRHVREDLAAAEARARKLAEELAARGDDREELSAALAAERAGIEEHVRALTRSVDKAAEERATLEQVVADQARMLEEAQEERARAREQIERASEELRQTQAELEQAEGRARTLASESAARATEHSERVRALVAEREAAEERARTLTERFSADTGEHDEREQRAAQEREALELALAQATRLTDEARSARAKAEATASEYAARLARAESDAAGAEASELSASLAAAEERIRALTEDAAERNSQHAERIDALLADLEAAEHAAQESRRVAQEAEARMFEAQAEARMSVEQRSESLSEAHQALAEAHARAAEEAQARAAAEARAAVLEQQLDEAHVLPVFSPVEAGAVQSEPEQETVGPVEPDPWLAPAPVEVPEPWHEGEPDVEPAADTRVEPEVEEPAVEGTEPILGEPVAEEPVAQEPAVEEPKVEVEEPAPFETARPSPPQAPPDPAPEPRSPLAGRAAPATYDSKRGAGMTGVVAGLVALACAAAVGWLAYNGTLLDRANESIGLTVAAMLAMAVALGRRSQSSEVHLDRGTLRLRFGDTHHTFYLNSPNTRLEMDGRPGDRDWRLKVLRRGMAPVTIDAKDVDPVAFTEALHQWRPTV